MQMAPKFFVIFFIHKICISFLFFTCNATNTTLPKFTTILIFGDSLVDTGNNNVLQTNGKANHPPYGISFPNQIPTGRFSDGKLMSDFLAQALGIKDFVPPFLGNSLSPNDMRTGVCFASAGSGYDEITNSLNGVIPVTVQYNKYFKIYLNNLIQGLGEYEARNIMNNTFVFAASGSNDMFFNYYIHNDRRSQYNLDAYQNFLLGKIQDLIKALYAEGIRNIAIAGLPPLGCVPFLRPDLRCLDEQNSDSQLYNNKLIVTLAQLQTSLPGSKLVYADLFNPLRDMVLNPTAYGFTDVYDGCCGLGMPVFGSGCVESTPRCSNPKEYLHWDIIHPTEAAYSFITQTFEKNLLPQFL